MFLKRIELSGFKSFADRTELEFVRGITAVVGPNGSGKSNISDSIRWVLGEQSAKSLRGGKMEDVIFAGSDSRKPINFGEVSLTLDNTDEQLPLDFSEVTVTRRIHRNGDSEYFINKQACRLRDITELFMDTGIGKEAYSIIGQGKIEEILSTKSEDRRGIFEEASGIVKYKSRKKEAQKKLDDTEQNLLRLHDLLSELEDQIEPLHEQSEKATLYKQLREQLKTNEISLYVYQIEKIHEAWTEAGAAMRSLQDNEAELAAIIGKYDVELEQHRMDVRTLEEQIDQLQADLLQISEEAEKCEGQGEVLKERKRNLQQNKERLELAIEAGKERRAAAEAEIAEVREKVEAAGALLKQIEAQLTDEEAKLLGVASGMTRATEEEHKAELLDILNGIAQHRNEIRYVEQQVESSQRQMDKLAEEKDHAAHALAEAEQARNAQAAEQLQIAAEIEQARNDYITSGNTIKARQQTLSEAQEILRRWEQKINALTSRRETLQEMKDDYDGFMHGVKAVLKARGATGGLRGVHGAVAELIKVPAEYETAIETAMGGALQHVIMEHEAAARDAIAFLKQRQLGRATFLPLDVIRGRVVPQNELRQIEQVEGFVGIAADLIEFDAKYSEVMRNLLGAVIVATNLENANRIAARGQYRYRVVTLDGDIVNAGGSMTGGSQHRKNTSLLGRQRQIDELEQEIAASQQQLSAIEGKTKQLQQELQEHAAQLEALREHGEQLRMKEQQAVSELNRLEAECKTWRQQMDLAEGERALLEQEKEQLVERQLELTKALRQLEAEEQAAQQAIREAEANRKAFESQKDELQQQLTELKVQSAAAAQEKQGLQEQLRRMTADKALLESDLQQQIDSLHTVEQELEANREDTVRQVELLNSLQLRRQQCAEQIDFKRAERAERLRYIETEEAKTKEERTRLKQIEEQLHQTEVRLNRLDVELEGLLNKLSEEYELSFELAKQRYPVPEDILGTQNIVRDLKRQISALGEVNLGAIEEYQRVSERFAFLSQQQSDLIEAKQSLYQVIKEMDDEMSKRFYTTFEEIRKHFVVVFARLFGGGKADLILSEPNRPLDTGIEIVAQPPGKKLQNLQLLSGGERALTAIALLFAILHVKPVPFCVLDEVEAALDEANVTRFAEYLREFSEQTQFIVVTHRKGTMEEADVLYGVTMEEGGVSKLVSVKLEDDEAVSA